MNSTANISPNSANQRVLITGGASGIGLGIAKYLGSQGHPIIISDIDQSAINDSLIQLKELNIEAMGVKLDVSRHHEIESLPQQLEGKEVSILINNAGLQFVSRLEDFPAEKWQTLIDVMLVGPSLLAKQLMPTMRKNGFGRIINIGSLHSVVASPFKSAYISAKHGLLGFSKTVALETGDTDITINTICPAYVKTPLVEKQIADQAKNHGITEQEVINNIMLKPMPKKAFIDVNEIAHTASFLISDFAKNITGQAIVIDGGWTSQ